MDDVQNIGKCSYDTQDSESFKVSTLADFQSNAKKKEKWNKIPSDFVGDLNSNTKTHEAWTDKQDNSQNFSSE